MRALFAGLMCSLLLMIGMASGASADHGLPALSQLSGLTNAVAAAQSMPAAFTPRPVGSGQTAPTSGLLQSVQFRGCRRCRRRCVRRWKWDCYSSERRCRRKFVGCMRFCWYEFCR